MSFLDKFLIVPKSPKKCAKCDKFYFEEECIIRTGVAFTLYCCPQHEEVVLYRKLA